MHCKVSSNSELVSFLNQVNEKGHNTALASFALMAPASIFTGTLISPIPEAQKLHPLCGYLEKLTKTFGSRLLKNFVWLFAHLTAALAYRL